MGVLAEPGSCSLELPELGQIEELEMPGKQLKIPGMEEGTRLNRESSEGPDQGGRSNHRSQRDPGTRSETEDEGPV